MPKRYEEEINEILHKFDDWPPPNERGQRPRREQPRRTEPLIGFGQFFEHIGPPQLMAIGLLLILAGVVLHYGAQVGVAIGVGLGRYATAIGFLVLLAGYIMAVARGGGLGLHRAQHTWRGEVIDLRPSNRGLAYWWWRLRRNGPR
ncbi:MAG TPA: hypothetical protein VK457_15895 [Chloroflexota bacterium]|nr:hypothetical protein [Chloroflexota bacterium]